VIGSNGCVVGTGEGGFKFNSEGDFVGVHRWVPFWLRVVFCVRHFCVAMTHMEPWFERNIQPLSAGFTQNSACILTGQRCPNITPQTRPNMHRITRRTCGQNATVRKRWPHVRSMPNHGGVS
jgi:hypothetical protein